MSNRHSRALWPFCLTPDSRFRSHLVNLSKRWLLPFRAIGRISSSSEQVRWQKSTVSTVSWPMVCTNGSTFRRRLRMFVPLFYVVVVYTTSFESPFCWRSKVKQAKLAKIVYIAHILPFVFHHMNVSKWYVRKSEMWSEKSKACHHCKYKECRSWSTFT